MAKIADKLIDKLKLENLNIESLKDVINFEPQLSPEWSLNDQLDAIDLLGYTASKEALLYLQKLYEPFVVVKQSVYWQNPYSNPKKKIDLVQHYNYLNAKGPLAEALHYEIPLFKNTRHHLKRLKPVTELENEQRTVFEKSLAHTTLRKALDRLQRSVLSHQEY
ncbi:MAG: hypothetical protein L0Z73_09930 [Gammaproteobacteria bacterium]|nr:hypothetical protein [Gammaproteobacteria bacterium]